MSLDMKLSKSLTNLAQVTEEIDKQLGLNPIVYGSLSLYFHTKIESVIVHDIDYLISEEKFPEIQKCLDQKNGYTYELLSWKSLRVFKDGEYIEFDSVERYGEGLSLNTSTGEIDRMTFTFLSKEDLKKMYTKATEKSSGKYEEYMEKLGMLK